MAEVLENVQKSTKPTPARSGVEIKACSKCHSEPATPKHRWCLKCKADAQAKFRATELLQAEASGFHKGCEAMRETLRLEFRRLGLVQVSCFDISEAIARSPRPRLELMVGALAASKPGKLS